VSAQRPEEPERPVRSNRKNKKVSTFRVGDFHRQKVFGLARPFCPVMAASRLEDINLDGLLKRGKKVILVDVDNTLVQWRGENFEKPVLAWIEKAKAMGFKVCLVSNTNWVERLERLSGILGVDYVRGRYKPSRSMYRKALDKFGIKASEAIMIGDQLFTDIFGANRTGIEAIWVKKMEGPEFGPTMINRFGEKILLNFLYRAMPSDVIVADEAAQAVHVPILQRPIVRQFAKFAVVGLGSTIIDRGILWFLTFTAQSGSRSLTDIVGSWLRTSLPGFFSFASTNQQAAVLVFTIFSASIAILNSFYWNRKWTFGIRGKEERLAQLQKFVIVAVIGLVLNAFLTTSLNRVIAGHPKRSLAVAIVISTIVVSFWNFFGQRLWTFRKHA
jgi:HAD superfamily phosphatase (TIGR01668 family)